MEPGGAALRPRPLSFNTTRVGSCVPRWGPGNQPRLPQASPSCWPALLTPGPRPQGKAESSLPLPSFRLIRAVALEEREPGHLPACRALGQRPDCMQTKLGPTESHRTEAPAGARRASRVVLRAPGKFHRRLVGPLWPDGSPSPRRGLDPHRRLQPSLWRWRLRWPPA